MNILIENTPTSRTIRFLRNCIYEISRFLELLLPVHTPRITAYCYHSITNDGRGLSVTPDEFKKQIEFLCTHQMPLRVSELDQYLSGAKRLTRDAFVLTFDDGYKTILSVKDYLSQHNIYPVAFVLSDNVHANYAELDMPEGELLKSAEIRELSEAGWDIGSHSKTHMSFSQLTGAEAKSEVLDSKAELERTLNISVDYFAYPKGAYTPEILRVAEKSAYKFAFSMDDGYVSAKAPRYALPRVGVDATHTMRQFPYLAAPFSMIVRSVIKKFT